MHSDSFRAVRCLGEGAQARVYLVEHEGELHCVKRVAMANPKAAEQALKEACTHALNARQRGDSR